MEGDGLNCNNTFGKQAGSAVLRREQVDKDEMVESLYEKHHSIDIKPEYTDRQQFTNIKTEYDEKQHPININIGYFEKQYQLTNSSMMNRDNSSTPQPISNINTGQMQVSDMKTEDSVKSHKQQRVLNNYTELPYKHQQVINNNTRHTDKQQKIPSIYIECGPNLPHKRDGYSVSCSIKKESKSAETTDACMSHPSGTYIGQEKTPPTMEQDTNKDVHHVMKFPQNLNSLDLSHVNHGNQFVFKKENSNFWQNNHDNELRQNKDTGFKLYFHDSEASQNSKSVQPGKVTDKHNKTVLRCSKEIIYIDQNETFQNTKKLKRNDAKLVWLKNEEREATVLTGTLMKHKRCLCKGTSDIMGEDKILLPHVFSIREDNILVPPVPMSIGKKNIGDKISNFSSKTDNGGGLQTIILSDNSDNVDGMCSVSTTGRPVSQNTNIEKDKRMTIMFEKIDQHVDHSSNIGYSLNKDGHEEDTVNKREDHARRCKQKRQQECIAGLSDFDSSYKKKPDKSCSSSGQKKCNKDTRKKCLNDKTPNSNAMVHNVKITNNDITNKCGNKGLSLHDDLECNVCSKRFVNMFNLKRHVKTAKHISNKYGNKGLSLHGLECNVCSNRFANMYNLKRHYISVHARRNQESSDDENTKNTNAQLSKLKALERDEDLKSSPANNEHDERNETETKTPSNIDSMHVPVDGVCGEDKNVYSDDHNDITNIPTDDNEFSSVILKCARCQFYLGTQAMKAELLLRYPNIDGYDNKDHHIQHVNKSRQSHSGKPPTKMSSYQMRIKLKRKYSNKKRGKKSLDALTCDICEQTFQTKEMLCNHIPTHFEKISFQCLICGEDHNDRQNLIEHIPIHIHHQNKEFCEPCSKVFKNVETLRIHNSEFHQIYFEKKHICSYCKQEFFTKGKLERHVNRNHFKKQICKYCNKSFRDKTHLRCHTIKKHTKEFPFRCHICGKGECLPSAFRRHLAEHEGKDVECTTCGKMIPIGGSNYNRHQRQHEQEEVTKNPDLLFVCDICGKKFVRKYHFQNHLKVHSGKKTYNCDICGESFGRTDNLNTHRRTHTGYKPYTCDTCGKQFARGDNLKTHIKKMHS